MSEENEMSAEEVLNKMREDLQAVVEAQASIAIMYRAKFDALVKMGFSEEQALELVKARGLGA